ncbi:MAG: Na+:solute symporter [Acidobacteriota bacterium]|nr:MAG: Na+:solute symporter [Acidobacteriota bacterium]
MKLNLIDILIICGYLASTVVIGLVLKKRAQQSKKSYLLGGNRLPWYLLGLSNASGMFDISGTMWLVTIGFVYGLKSIWLPWLWPTFNQIFLMVFLSIWLRRSNVTTGAEWIGTRFGQGMGARLSHNVVVVFALVSCLGFLAYGFVGLGKFMMIFIPWETVCGTLGINPGIVPPEYIPHVYGVVFTFFATLYAVLGGMVSIVWADLLQYIIMTISSVMIAVIAMNALSGSTMAVPEGWMSPWFGLDLNLDWSSIIPQVNQKIADDGFSLFSIFFMMMLFKGLLVSAAGPAPNYDMQKILSTKSPREGAMMSGFVSVILNPIRYLMITGFVVLGVLYYDRLNLIVGGEVDFEQILPSAISEFVPIGLMGLLLAGLLAAFMSTFAGTLNAAQAYVINDIYLKVKTEASNVQITRANYVVGTLIVLISIVLGVFAQDVNSLLQWIVSALWGSYIAANVLKWYWWRFNGYGYFFGMAAGLIPALIFPLVFKQTLELYYFPWIMLISLAGCIIGTYRYPPTDEKTLCEFYRTVRPWGFWGPIHEKVAAQNPDFQRNKNFWRDMFNVVVGIVWQTAIVAIAIYTVLLQWTLVMVCAVGIALTSWVLKKTWWDRLPAD